MARKYLAEYIGTFTLVLLVLLSTTSTFIPTPIVAGLTVMLLVYLIGGISGCHINPAVTIGALSVKKITSSDAIKYVFSQFFGAITALVVISALGFTAVSIESIKLQSYFFEFLGVVLLTFGIGFVVFGKISSSVHGLIIGTSLFLGVLIAVFGGAAGILNPAVGLAFNTTFVVYYVVQILGGIAGFQLAKFMYSPKD